jgi:uncharacterized protein YbjQ (UPF0145 family)
VTEDAITTGGEAGRERLRENKEGLFTSDLTVNEYLLIEDAGFEPLGLVVGSSIYHVGYQRRSLSTSHELTVLSEALYHARELAMERMTREAEELGADGIVGVRLDVMGFQKAQHVAEFLAVGTAIRHRNSDTYRPAHGRPFTSDLSGQDFWTLLRTGARPVALVLGVCVYSVASVNAGKVWRAGRNLELTHFTQALYDAREIAMSRMQHEAKAVNANGIVGVGLEEHHHGWGGRAIEFLAIGTAITRHPPETPAVPPTPVLDLNDNHDRR